MRKLLIYALFSFLGIGGINAQTMPTLVENNGNTQLFVDGKPFVMLAGELHNSSTGSAHYMAPIWKRMHDKNLNTVFAAVSWELTEPEEGKFDFSLVDSTIVGARKENLKLVLLWFGTWKNGASTYAPSWIKMNAKRFPLACLSDGEAINTLSAFGTNTMKADAKAFAALMNHLKEIDGQAHTVLMVQVENEIGTLDMIAMYMNKRNRAMRDFSDVANKAFKGNVPESLMAYLKSHKKTLHPAIAKAWKDNGGKMTGTWETVFGKSQSSNSDDWQNSYPYLTDEIFNAWNYASYVETIAHEGKKAYPLPIYVNAWLKQSRGREPGTYPSGAAHPHLFDIWRAAAPDIDIFAPDIYAIDIYDWVCKSFNDKGNPLFIPETTATQDGAARAFYTFGKYQTLCYSPFGIDGNGLAHNPDANDQSYEKTYYYLKNLMHYIIKYSGTNNMAGLLINKNHSTDSVEMGKYTLTLRPFSYRNPSVGTTILGDIHKPDKDIGLIVFKLSEGDYLVAGGLGDCVINVKKNTKNKAERSCILSVDEITFDSNGIQHQHRLNGDEISYGGPVVKDNEVKAFRIKMYEY